jgi:hypothetical protein
MSAFVSIQPFRQALGIRGDGEQTEPCWAPLSAARWVHTHTCIDGTRQLGLRI